VQIVKELFARYGEQEMVLVGHCMTQDLRRLEEMGIELGERLVLDTGNLERVYCGRVNGQRRSLREICEHLDIKYFAPWRLHNAGNDAFFTMAVFAKMCCLPGQ
jgi:DNA polymerase III epsilon subunit-like protein